MKEIEIIFIDKIKNLLKTDEISDLKFLQQKEGRTVIAFSTKGKYYVFKHFKNLENTREIENYKLLTKLNVKTLNIVCYGSDCFIMEDITKHPTIRLACKNDLNDPQIVASLANWYKDLHKKGEFINKENLYCEFDLINRQNLEILQEKLPTSKGISSILENVDHLKKIFYSFKHTILYNDFASCNMAIENEKKAFMFDYDLLGYGCAVSDVYNVLSSLPTKSKSVFLKNYGALNERELKFNTIISSAFALISAYKREKFPFWAEETRKYVLSETFHKKVKEVLNFD